MVSGVSFITGSGREGNMVVTSCGGDDDDELEAEGDDDDDDDDDCDGNGDDDDDDDTAMVGAAVMFAAV